MSTQRAFIPKFRVHVAASRVNDEILITPMKSWALSPYFEIDAGYAWCEFEPVSVIPSASSPDILGKLVKAAIQIVMFHYQAPEARYLLEKREVRREFLIEKFGKDNPRFIHPRAFSFVASIASDFNYFMDEYNHVLVEDDGDANLRFIDNSMVNEFHLHHRDWIDEANLEPIRRRFPHNRSDKELGEVVLKLAKLV